MHRMLTRLATLVLVLSLLGASRTRAQATAFDRLTPPLPTAAERHVADVASWATAIAAVALDAKASWDAGAGVGWLTSRIR